jgi:cholesterol oxidase
MGGGSLIYANVIARPPDGWLKVDGPEGGQWPVDKTELDEHFEEVEHLLNPVRYPETGPFADTPKTRAFLRAAERAALEAERIPLAIQFDDGGGPARREPFGAPDDNIHRVQRYTCDMLGACDLGCNAGAKHSLDFAVLGALKNAATLRPWAEVRRIRPLNPGFAIDLLDHREAAETSQPARKETITCRRLILCAGTLGTVLLLLRSRLDLPGLSQAVGRHFSANGDYLAFAARCKPVGPDGAPGTERDPPIKAFRGPVITASARGVDRSEGGDGPGFHLQDGGFPSWAEWLGMVGGIRRDLGLVAAGVRSVVEGPGVGRPDQNLSLELSRLVDDAGERVLPILALGRDMPDGRLHLRGGRLDLDWRKRASAAVYERAAASARLVTNELGGQYVDPLRFFRPITVHPLGGCAMSRDARTGVVDPDLCVHNVPGLSIADGSVLPGPVGINPAMTIAALADRHGKHLVEQFKACR